jgi:hypothetical protein
MILTPTIFTICYSGCLLQCFTLLKVYVPTAPLEAAENMPDTECLPMPVIQICNKKYINPFKLGTVEVLNSNSISCSNNSLLECSPVTQAAWVRFPAETDLSLGALVEDFQVSL